MSAVVYLGRVLRILLAAGLFASLLVGGTRPAQAQVPDRTAQAQRDFEAAKAAFKEHDLAKARSLLEEAVGLVPRFTDAQYLLGVVEARAERWQEALDHYEKAIEIGPPQAVHHYGAAVCQRALGQAEASRESLAKARDLVRGALAKDKAPAAALNQLMGEIDFQGACLARDAGDEEACRRLLDAALVEFPSNAKIQGEKGASLLRAGDAKGAVQLLESALAAAPDDLSILYTLGRALVAAGRTAEGKEKLELYRRKDEERREELNAQRRKLEAQKLAFQADALLKQGNKDAARDLAKKAYAFDPKNTLAEHVLEATQ